MNWKLLISSMALGITFLASTANAQLAGDSPELLQLIKNAGDHLNKGQYDNAAALYKQAIRMAPDNIALRKDLAYTYLLKREYNTAREIITQVLKSSAADAQVYQIASAIELQDGKSAKAKRIINNGLDKFPHSGVLYNAKGNHMITESKSAKPALKEWLRGIAVDPAFPTNYYNAAKTLFKEGDYIWTIIYAEKFVNLESQTAKAVEMRKILFDAYKQVFQLKYADGIPDFNTNPSASKNAKLKFEDAFVHAINANISTVADGFSLDNVSMLRTRFLIFWNNHYEERFPQSIISYQSRLMKAGHYPAYNQWLFGAMISSQEFSTWLGQFKSAYQKFEQWKQTNVYIPNNGDAALAL
jgi:tetratricopeptide (TPR) repeat protein